MICIFVNGMYTESKGGILSVALSTLLFLYIKSQVSLVVNDVCGIYDGFTFASRGLLTN